MYVCDLETSTIERPRPDLGYCAPPSPKKNNKTEGDSITARRQLMLKMEFVRRAPDNLYDGPRPPTGPFSNPLFNF